MKYVVSGDILIKQRRQDSQYPLTIGGPDLHFKRILFLFSTTVCLTDDF